MNDNDQIIHILISNTDNGWIVEVGHEYSSNTTYAYQQKQEVLDFVEFLLFKNKPTNEQAVTDQTFQQEVLTGLDHIRETLYQTYGVYEGDLVAETRAERKQQIDLILGLDASNESSS